jgi:Na+/proline symporter
MLTYPLAVFILLLIAILLLKKRRKGMPLEREDRILAYVGLISAIILGFLQAIFQVNPSILGPYTQTFAWILFISIIVIIAGIIALYFKNKGITAKDVEKTDYYSPIHAMIVKVNIETPREQALAFSGIGKGVNVKQLRIDFQSISSIFTQHAKMFKDEDLVMWDAIEKQIKAYSNGGGFFINKDVQEWFDDLEARYNH